MCAPILIPLVSAAIGAGSSLYSNRKLEKQQDKQRKQQEAEARQQANQRGEMQSGVVNIDGEVGAGAGLGNTFLTGAGGIGTDQLNLGNGTNRTLGG